jgi:N-acetylmuramoyl-L-alanine amidase
MLLISLLFSISYSFHVIIDPGHGGIDTGAAYYGSKEADITLKVSKLLAQKLSNETGIKVSLSRAEDKAIELTERAKIAHKNKGDLFISIHTNSSPERRAKGLEVYVENVLPPDQESLFLAYRENQFEISGRGMGRPSQYRENYSAEVSSILDDIAKSHYLFTSLEAANQIQSQWQEDRGGKARLRQAPFFVVSSINMPSVLVEIGFLSNSSEAEILKDPKQQEKIAETLTKSVLKFKERIDKRKI